MSEGKISIFDKSPNLPKAGPDTVILIKSHVVPDDPDQIPSNLEEFGRILNKLKYDVRLVSCNKFVPITPRPFQLVRWFPRSIFGFFKSFCSVTKLFAIATLILYYKKSLNLTLVVVEELSYIIPALNLLGGLKIVYIEDVLKQLPVNNHIYHYRLRNRRHQLHYLKYVDKIVVSNKISKRILEHEELKIKNKPILLYPNIEAPKYLEITYFSANHILDLLDNESVIILTFGDYTPESNFQLAINGFRRILKKCRSVRRFYDNFFMIICGNCRNKQQMDYMKKMMEENIYGDNLIFTRNMPFDFKLGLLKHATCVLFPSTYYNHDQILLMQCIRLGKIIIATKCDIADELIDHENNGYICRKPSPKQFEKYISKVLVEPQVHNTMGQVGAALFSDCYGEVLYTFGVKGILGLYNNSQYIQSTGPISRELISEENIFCVEEPSFDSQESQLDSNDCDDVFEDSVESSESADLSDQTIQSRLIDETPHRSVRPVARILTFSDSDSQNEDNFEASTQKETVSTSVRIVSSKSELDLDSRLCSAEELQPDNSSYVSYEFNPNYVMHSESISPRPGCSKEPDEMEEIDLYEDDLEYDEDREELESDNSDSDDTYTETVVGKKVDSDRDSDSDTLSEDYSPNQSYSMHSEPEDEIPDLPLDETVQFEEEVQKNNSEEDKVVSNTVRGDIKCCKELTKNFESGEKNLSRVVSWGCLPRTREIPLFFKRNKSCPRDWKPLQNP